MNMVPLWPMLLEALQALGTHYGPAMDQAAAQLGLPTPEWNGWLLAALMFEPEPISAVRLRRRSPYTSARLINERLAKAARQGFLTPVAEAVNDYRLTQTGKQAAERVIGAAYMRMGTLQPIASTDMERLASLLHRLVTSCLTAPVPPGKWSILHSRRTDPGDNASVVVQIDQYGSDLAAYRDDAHLAAWTSHNLEGHAWDALTCLWRGEATNPDELQKKLERRGYSRDEYGQALADLLQRGWVREEEGIYQVTDHGREIRQAAEEKTDQYFYAPWSCLSHLETEEMRNLLRLFRESLQPGG
jgi:DNA-binding PadR family transcriptional regulator